MDSLDLNKKFNINIFKHDKDKYRVYKNCKLVKNDNEMLVFSLGSSYIEQKYKKNYKINEETYWFFPRNKWFNIIWFRELNKFKFYVNIASPLQYSNSEFEFIDYDIDLKVNKDFSYSIIDMKDFNKNRVKLNYNHKIIESIWDSIDSVKKIIKNKELIFNQDYQDKFIKEVNNG